jgi:diguanylate cyclase (GGDEF)-like protein/PAS domain S-box-containing protein
MSTPSVTSGIDLDLEKSFGALEEFVVVTRPDRRIIFVNDAMEEAFGYKRNELIGKTSEIFFANPEDFVEAGKIYNKDDTSAANRKFTMLFRRKNGRTFTAEVVSTAIFDANSTHIGFVSIARDITDRLTLESMLSNAAATLEDALDTISEGFALYDEQDRLVVCNEKYREIYAHSAPAIVTGNTFREVLQYGLDRQQYDLRGKTEEEWLKERLDWHLEASGDPLEQMLGDGTWLQIAERRTRSGGRAGIRTDITDLKAAQEKAQRAHKDLALLADNLSCAITEVDMTGTCVFINTVAAQWFNGTRKELLGTRLRERFSAQTTEKTTPYFQRALSGVAVNEEMLLQFPDGIYRETAIEYTPKRDEKGDLIGLIVFATDISDRKNTERTLSELYSITSTRAFSTEEKIGRILELGCRHFGIEFGIISNISGEHYSVEYALSPNGEIPPGASFPLGDTYCVHTLAADGPVAITHAATSDIASHPCYEKFALETYIGAPLLVDGEKYGTINFTSPSMRQRPFTQTDQELIRQFADWIGNELARQRDHDALMEAHARLERMASIDDLTGILNRRAFMEQAATEVSRYRRTGVPLSVVMMDIDHFKSINDNYGHAAGDSILQRFSKLVADSLRATDVFGRIGGEEFCIIFGDSRAESAQLVSERIRKTIAEKCATGLIPGNVTCSIGISTITKMDVDISAVMQRADQALYEAKEGGRNRSLIFTENAAAPAAEAPTGKT